MMNKKIIQIMDEFFSHKWKMKNEKMTWGIQIGVEPFVKTGEFLSPPLLFHLLIIHHLGEWATIVNQFGT